MRSIKLVIIALISLAILAYTIAFARFNSLDVSVDFLWGSYLTLPFSAWFGVAMIVGLLIGYGLSAVLLMRQAFHRRRLEKQLSEAQERLRQPLP